MTSLARRWAAWTAGLPAVFWSLWVGTLITKAGTFVVPLMFIYLTQERGLSLSVGGNVVGLYGLGSLLGTLLGGAAADRVGRRATMLASLVSGAGFLLALGAARGVGSLAALAFLLGLSSEAYRPAAQALVADVVPPALRMRAFGLQYWAVNLGFSFAAVVGGFMARRNFHALFVADALTTLALAGIIWSRVPESRPESPSRAQGSLLSPFLDRRYLPFLVLNFLVVLVFFQHLTALPEDMRRKGLTTEHFGLAVATNGVLIVLLQPTLTRWLAAVPRPTLLAAASTLTGVGFGLTALARTLPGYMLTVALWTVGEIIFAPVNASLVADLSPAHLRGRYQGAFGLTWSLGAMLSPVLGPRLIQATSPRAFWLGCLALGLATALAHLTVLVRVLPRRGATP
ncbi:MAG: MFS transporter [Deltaproteobacteria bacterium]|nr:MFS transporter [Deltaproteobacteria bacterium]